MKKTRRKYESSFKRDAVELYHQSKKSCQQIEMELGIGSGILKRWVREFSSDPQHCFRGNGHMVAEQAELKKLQRELKRVTTERDILKKAVAIFSAEPNKYLVS